VIVLENTNQINQGTTEAEGTTEVQDIPMTTEAEDHHMGVIQVGIIQDQVEERVINF
jgi:hypothetical protein